MKRSMLGLLQFLIFLFAVISCEESRETPNEDDEECPVYFKVNVTNNTDSQVDVHVMPVLFGASGYDENIYINEEKYNAEFGNGYAPQYSDFTEKLQKEGCKEHVSGSNIYVTNESNTYEDEFIDKTVDAGGNFEKANLTIYGQSSILIEIKFADGKISRLAGWPKYFNNKLGNVKKYGFYYNVWSDKKVYLYHKDENNRYVNSYFFDESENIAGGYVTGPWFNYPMTITINSADDITLKISEIEFNLDKESSKETVIIK